MLETVYGAHTVQYVQYEGQHSMPHDKHMHVSTAIRKVSTDDAASQQKEMRRYASVASG